MSRAIHKNKGKQKRETSSDMPIAILDTQRNWLKGSISKEARVYPNRKSIREAIAQPSYAPFWISMKQKRTEDLLKEIVSSQPGNRRRFGSLFMREPPRPEILAQLHGCFDAVVGESPSFTMLPTEQLLAVLSTKIEQSRDLFIGGDVDEATGSLALVRGNRERLTVPLAMFQPSGTTSPDFSDFALEDCGHTLRFGDYEAAADSVLWEVDADFRRRARANERAHAEGLGPSIRRLRKKNGLSQSDFSPLPTRTIARIENGEAKNPRAATLSHIATILGVAVNELDSY